MTASIWTEMGAAYLAWILLVAAVVAVWAVFVFLAWISRLIEKWSRRHRDRHLPQTYEDLWAATFQGSAEELRAACKELARAVGRELFSKPFDQEKD